MKKEIYYKLIELENHQFLVKKMWDHEDEKDKIELQFHEDGMELSVKLGYDNEEDRDKYFNSFDEEKAQGFVDSILSTLK